MNDILAAADFHPALKADITGDDPVLRTPYRIGRAGAEALGALGLAAAQLWQLRGGKAQRVAIGVRAAAASLRSARYLRIDGRAPRVWDPLSGFYPVRDGWISIHCNFQNHRHAALSVLKSNPSREEAEAHSRNWRGVELEDAIHAAGGCAGFVRSGEAWARHPQAQAVAKAPLLEITRIGDAPAEKFSKAKRPLEGVRVLDLTRVLAGPTCARSLAEHGAEVLKISAEHLPDSGEVELDTGIGKLSARLDLRKHADLARLHALAHEADVFSQSYRPGALAGRGLSSQSLAELRPGIVCVSLSAWGETGPWRARRGFDSIVQSVSGMALAQGEGGKPQLLPVSAIDYVSGYLMAFGAMVALSRRSSEGGSWLVRVSLARVGRWIVEHGMLPDSAWRALADDLPETELAPLLAEVDSPAGRVRHLKPVLELSETPPYWSRPPVPLGYHEAKWTSG